MQEKRTEVTFELNRVDAFERLSVKNSQQHCLLFIVDTVQRVHAVAVLSCDDRKIRLVLGRQIDVLLLDYVVH